MVNRVAIEHLPAELPDFLRAPRMAEDIGELGREPDRLRGAGMAFDADQGPAHFIDLEDNATTSGGIAIDPLPRSREEFDRALGEKGQSPYDVGYLPHSIVENWQRLRLDFAYWRVILVGEKSAIRQEDREWISQDRRRREMLIIQDIGWLGHFVGDASQPLHVSVHSNGWGNFPNPHNYSTSKKLHAQFEGEFVRANIELDHLRTRMRTYLDCACSIEQRTSRYLLATHAQVIPLYELEKASAFAGPDAKGKEFVADRLAAGAAELRDMITDAWRSSTGAKVGFPAVSVRGVEEGKEEPLPALMGLD